MRVLVTRPREDAERTAEALRTRGHDPLVRPLLALHALPCEAPDRAWAASLFTSRHAVRFAPVTIDRARPALAVGHATATALRDAGFTRVQAGGGDVERLMALVLERLRPEDGPLAYPCGRHRTGDLANRLRIAGYDVTPLSVYDMRETHPEGEPPDVIAGGAVDAVLLYSARSAAAFAAAFSATAFSGGGPKMRIICLSDGVARALPGMMRENAVTASAPNEAALFDALERD